MFLFLQQGSVTAGRQALSLTGWLHGEKYQMLSANEQTTFLHLAIDPHEMHKAYGKRLTTSDPCEEMHKGSFSSSILSEQAEEPTL